MITRKLSKSFAQRGLLGTAGRCITRPIRYAHSGLLELTPTWRRLRRNEQRWDCEFGVDTCPGKDLGWMADIDSPNWVHGRGYHPAPTKSLTKTLTDLQIAFEEFVFIDFGSGKGRSLFVASQFPFKEIIGVEYSESLHKIAEQNIASYANPAQQGKNIRAVHADAAEYPIPTVPAVLYFYDPFGEPVMRKVVDRICASLAECPRHVFIVYYNPVFAEMFEECDLFERRYCGEQFIPYWSRTVSGGKDANQFESEKLDPERFVVYEARG